MFIKIQHLVKEQGTDSWGIGRCHMIDCDEYIKEYSDSKSGNKILNLKTIKNKTLVRDMIFDCPTLHIDFFIENNEGKTVERFTYQNKTISTN